jgi:hypothetical protein
LRIEHELIKLSGVQLLIFAVAYAVWGPYGKQLLVILDMLDSIETNIGTHLKGIETNLFTQMH